MGEVAAGKTARTGPSCSLDFSSIKDTLAKGGVVATTFNCPQCAGPLSRPETGKQTTCKYCGATIKPVDLFEKIKSLVG